LKIIKDVSLWYYINLHLDFKAHSDGDVAIHWHFLMHLFGASEIGDIGELFSRYHQICITIKLNKLLEEIKSYYILWIFIGNIDLPIIAQTPKTYGV